MQEDKAPTPIQQQKQTEEENPKTFDAVISKLDSAKATYSVLQVSSLNSYIFSNIQHKPVKTSQEAAQIRGVSLDSGAKAMLIKNTATKGMAAGIPVRPSTFFINNQFILVIMSASKKFNWKLLKKLISAKKIDLAGAQDVLKITGCISGAVPPFGSVFDCPTIVDQSLIDQGDQINFNAGLRTKSVSMGVKEYLQIEKPLLVSNFTKSEDK